MSNRSETFGRLLKGAINSIATYEGRTAPVIEEELAEKVGLAGSAIQRYKSGYLPPEPRTIEIIAEAAVRRGLFSREWLQRFLHAARYHQADKLLDSLCPIGPARPRPPRVYQNLPAPTYSQFVMRAEAFAEVLDGLSKRSAAVIIVGLGGNGKTSLAREIANHCLKGEQGQGLFDAAVWVSDKDRPGTTNLSVVLDEIARTLDYPGFTQFEHDEKRREVEQLLRRQRVLVCIDNVETITDGALLSWLLNIPEPSKTLITTREYRREYRRGGWPVELRGMSDSEARVLVNGRLKVLRIDKLVSDLAQLEPLIVATGGNPKAIEITLGLVKYERRSLQQVVDDLYAARGELFDDLFSRAWSILDEASRRVLMVLTFFPKSACSEALQYAADVHGFAFDRAIERLVDLALIDMQQEDLTKATRYAMHPLVRSFAAVNLTLDEMFEEKARERWISWGLNLSSQVGYCWNNLEKLEILETEYEAIYSALIWCDNHNRPADVIRLSRNIGYFYQVRLGWNQRLHIEELHLGAAQKMSASNEILTSLLRLLEGLSRTGQLSQAKQVKERLEKDFPEGSLSSDNRRRWETSLGIYYVSHQNYEAALAMFAQCLQNETDIPISRQILNRRWLATGHYLVGNRDEAKRQFEQLLTVAESLNHTRTVIYVSLQLASISIDEKCYELGSSLLSKAEGLAESYNDRERLAMIKSVTARLLRDTGDFGTAKAALIEAQNLFERLGMRRELAEAREELRRLDEIGEAPAA